MQDRYVGDIGDFANNGLLRVLCGTPPEPVPDMRLGIIWYRNETEDQYGNEIKYLNPSNYNDQTYRECDPHLYSELQRLVGGSMERNDRRRIEDIIDRGIFPPRTQHYRRLIPRPATVASRRQWFGDAMAKTAESDVIFLNPDIGINWTGQARLQYVHPWELEELLEPIREKIVVIYQHAQHADWVAENARLLRGSPLAVQYLWVCTWHSGPKRGYFIAARTENQRKRVEKRLEILRRSQWVERQHFLLEQV